MAAHIVERLDNGEDDLLFIGYGPEDRREMLRVAELLPDDVVAELYEDPWYPGNTFMELRLLPITGLYQPPPRPYADPWEGREHAV